MVANALAAASDAGVIHGDVKPSNVLLDTVGAIKLADFNVSRVTGHSGSVPGSMLVSFAYAAPEVWDGSLSASSDLYALGCVLYECLVGHPPFTGSYAAVFRRTWTPRPTWRHFPPTRRGRWSELIGQLLEKDLGRRPESAHAVAVRLADMRSALTPAKTIDLLPTFGPADRGAASGHAVGLVRAPPSERPSRDSRALFEINRSVSSLRRAVDQNDRLVPLGAET